MGKVNRVRRVSSFRKTTRSSKRGTNFFWGKPYPNRSKSVGANTKRGKSKPKNLKVKAYGHVKVENDVEGSKLAHAYRKKHGDPSRKRR